jgi:hypothetical protein
VGVATQFQGDLSKRQPSSLVAWQKSGGELKTLPMPKTLIKDLKGYIADIAYNDINQQLAVTAPRGNQVLIWDLQNHSLLKKINIREPSGLSFYNKKLLISNAKGEIFSLINIELSNTPNRLYLDPDIAWDNHLIIS